MVTSAKQMMGMKEAISAYVATIPFAAVEYDQLNSNHLDVLVTNLSDGKSRKFRVKRPDDGNPRLEKNVLATCRATLIDIGIDIPAMERHAKEAKAARFAAQRQQDPPRSMSACESYSPFAKLAEIKPQLIQKAAPAPEPPPQLDLDPPRILPDLSKQLVIEKKETSPVSAQPIPIKSNGLNGAHATTKDTPNLERSKILQSEIFKIGALLTQHCKLVDGIASYDVGWSDKRVTEIIAATARDYPEHKIIEKVVELRIENIGRLKTERPATGRGGDRFSGRFAALEQRNAELVDQVSKLEARLAKIEIDLGISTKVA